MFSFVKENKVVYQKKKEKKKENKVLSEKKKITMSSLKFTMFCIILVSLASLHECM